MRSKHQGFEANWKIATVPYRSRWKHWSALLTEEQAQKLGIEAVDRRGGAS